MIFKKLLSGLYKLLTNTSGNIVLLAITSALSPVSMAHASAITKESRMHQIVVAQDGSGDFSSIQEAINAVPSNSQKWTSILIKDGIYKDEKIIVPREKVRLIIKGESRTKTIISYHMYDCNDSASQNKCPAEAWQHWNYNKELIRTSATLTIMSDDLVVENLTISNTAGPVGQALALTLRGDRIFFNNCDILGYQDTVYLAKDGMRSYFYNCLILGRTDYIYGGGIGYFEQCEIKSFGGGWITAPSTPDLQPWGFVFFRCRFTSAQDSPRKGDDGKLIAIGRPWHNFPKVAILNSYMCSKIDPLGWPTIWRMPYANTSEKLHLYEFNNTGEGADVIGRARWTGIKLLDEHQAKHYQKALVLGNWEPLKP